MPVKTWKTRPSNSVLLEILEKKGYMIDTELFEALKEELKEFSFTDLNELLMKLEIGGKIRTTSMARGKRRIELVT